MPEPIIPDNRTIQTFAQQFAATKVSGSLSPEQVAVAIEGMDALRGRINYRGDSKTVAIIDRLFSAGEPVTPTMVTNALADAGTSPGKMDQAGRLLQNIDVLDNMRAIRVLKDKGFDERSFGRIIKATDNIVGAAAKKIGRRGIAGLGVLLGGIGKVAGSELAGGVGDFLQGTPGNAPGGISSAEIQDQPGGIPDSPISTFQQDPARPDLTLGFTDREVAKDERIEMRRLARGARRGDYDLSEEVLEEVRAAQGENEVIIDATSETSGSNNILRSIGTLLGRR